MTSIINPGISGFKLSKIKAGTFKLKEKKMRH